MSSTDPQLSSLCRICNFQTPKYKCPRCSFRSCSLKCAQLHKKRAQCSGVRDVAKVSRSELFTPTGLNNDYNFITGIERGIERADRIFIHEKGIIPRRSERDPKKRPPKRKYAGNNPDGKKPEGAEMFDPEFEKLMAKKRQNADVSRVMNKIRASGVIFKKAPDGMQRRKDNTTSITHKCKAITWQVEWITDDGAQKLHKLVESTPLGWGYEEILRSRMSEDVRSTYKRKKQHEHQRENAKRRKLAEPEPISVSYLQNTTARWNLLSTESILPGQAAEKKEFEVPPFQSPYYFYLLQPFTPSSKPKVLIPLDSTKPLAKLLRGRTVVEFPTIYVSTKKPKAMGKSFMMEKDFLAGKGSKKAKPKGKGLVEYSDSESESDSASNSGSDTDSDPAEKTDSEDEDEKGEVAEDPEDEDGGATSWSESESETSDDGSDDDGEEGDVAKIMHAAMMDT